MRVGSLVPRNLEYSHVGRRAADFPQEIIFLELRVVFEALASTPRLPACRAPSKRYRCQGLVRSDIEQGPQRSRGSRAACLCACLLSGSRWAGRQPSQTPCLVGSACRKRRHTARTITHDVYALPDVVVLGLERLRRLIAHPMIGRASTHTLKRANCKKGVP
jgi:hypothetical protein